MVGDLGMTCFTHTVVAAAIVAAIVIMYKRMQLSENMTQNDTSSNGVCNTNTPPANMDLSIIKTGIIISGCLALEHSLHTRIPRCGVKRKIPSNCIVDD